MNRTIRNETRDVLLKLLCVNFDRLDEQTRAEVRRVIGMEEGKNNEEEMIEQPASLLPPLPPPPPPPPPHQTPLIISQKNVSTNLRNNQIIPLQTIYHY